MSSQTTRRETSTGQVEKCSGDRHPIVLRHPLMGPRNGSPSFLFSKGKPWHYQTATQHDACFNSPRGIKRLKPSEIVLQGYSRPITFSTDPYGYYRPSGCAIGCAGVCATGSPYSSTAAGPVVSGTAFGSVGTTEGTVGRLAGCSYAGVSSSKPSSACAGISMATDEETWSVMSASELLSESFRAGIQ